MTASRTLLRTPAYPALFGGSIVGIAAGTWLVLDRLSTMTTGLENGTATGVEVYAGQAWVVVGAVLIGAGLLGVALSLALATLSSIVRRPSHEVDAPAEHSASPAADASHDSAHENVEDPAPVSADGDVTPASQDEAAGSAVEDQNGSSGSTAMATNSSVR